MSEVVRRSKIKSAAVLIERDRWPGRCSGELSSRLDGGAGGGGGIGSCKRRHGGNRARTGSTRPEAHTCGYEPRGRCAGRRHARDGSCSNMAVMLARQGCGSWWIVRERLGGKRYGKFLL
jgi:hypothetical protein